jgi:site-specific recombinase XerD
VSSQVYLSILNGFQRFVAERAEDKSESQTTIRQWLKDRSLAWPFQIVTDRARLVDRFLDWRVNNRALANNPFADLRAEYGQRTTAPVVRALLNPDPEAALEALRPLPRFGSFLGPVMREHVVLMHAMGYRYNTQAERLLRLDRFLQGRPDLSGHPLTELIREWTNTRSTPQHALDCHQAGRLLSSVLSRIDPTIERIPSDKRIWRLAKERYRQPYIFSEQDVFGLLETALSFPSPQSPLRPKTLHMMLVLAYCAGLRIGEIVRLNVGDFNIDDRVIEVHGTKFFKSRRVPLSDSAAAAFQAYLTARNGAGASMSPEAAMFWHQHAGGRYSRDRAGKLLVRVLRRAKLKPAPGRVGPRVHDLRHAFVAGRMLAWYREGINPQSRLPYLATYLGHKDINSTLVYLTVTQNLLQQASERFRVRGARLLQPLIEGGKRLKTNQFPLLLHAFFHDWLVQQRNVSHHTVLSYRGSWRLFLRFVAAQKTKSVARLGMDDLTAVEVLAFLKDIEEIRKSSIGTRNCRLSALHSFYSFVAEREPLAAAQCAAVLRIPTKRAPVVEVRDLDEDEISAILAQPNRLKKASAITSYWRSYITPVRVFNEALDLSVQALRLESPLQVRLFGKGRKERICPLWPETVELIKALLKRKPRREDEPIFVNRYGNPLKASGVRFKLKQYAVAAGKKVPSLASKRVSPHRFRHATAVSLVTAEVDVTVIRSWLGHESLDTTNIYARANVEAKRKALEKVDGAARSSKPPRWKREVELMAWLDSL